MKRFTFIGGLIFLVVLFVAGETVFAQGQKVRASLKAKTTQTIGADTEITIAYSRPGVKDRAIWGELVPYGLKPGNKYSDNKPFPWRAGADENTTISFNNDLLVEGEKLPAGTYSIHMIPAEDEWTVIFNKVYDAWGSYSYDESQDALRVKVTPQKAPHQEWLVYGFDELEGTSATAYLHWEELKVPFKVQLADQ